MKLKFLNGERTGEEIELRSSEITIGRDAANALQLLAGGVSRCHVCLRQTDDRGWIAVDRNSTNGTKINGIKINGEQAVFDGDVLTVGEQKLEVSGVSSSGVKVEFQPLNAAPINPESLFYPDEDDKPTVRIETPVPTAAARKNSSKSDSDVALQMLEALKRSGNGLFGKSDSTASAHEAVSNKPEAAKPRSRVLFNTVFYLTLAVAAISCFSLFFKNKPKEEQTAAPAAKSEDISFYYERLLLGNDNDRRMFRVEVIYDNGNFNYAIEDIVSSRYLNKRLDREKFNAEHADAIAEFIRVIRQSGIAKTPSHPRSPTSNYGERERFSIVINGEVKEFCFFDRGETPEAIDDVREALNVLLNEMNLNAIVMTRAEVEKEGLRLMENADYGRKNYLGDYKRLREAARDYQAAIDCFSQFLPPHPALAKAKRSLEEVNRRRQQLVISFQRNYRECQRQNDPAGMEKACLAILELSGEDSQAYRQAKKALLEIHQYQSRNRGER